MKEITTVGVDLAKPVFTVHGVDARAAHGDDQSDAGFAGRIQCGLAATVRASKYALIGGRLEICSLPEQRRNSETTCNEEVLREPS